MLLVDFQGSAGSDGGQAERCGENAGEFGGGPFEWATKDEDRSRLWQARHDAHYAALALRPGASGWTTDVCVPISRLAECIHETKADLVGSRLVGPLVGHVGDGNFHLVMPVNSDSAADLAEAERITDRLVERALAMGGTCSGEHGVGIGKMRFLEAEHGAAALDVMRAIKRALDPQNLMNPGKIVPCEGRD